MPIPNIPPLSNFDNNPISNKRITDQSINPQKEEKPKVNEDFYNKSPLTESSSIFNFKKSDLGNPISNMSWDEFAIFGNNVEKNSDIFRIGLKENNKGFADNQYEDPLYWGFSLDIDMPDDDSMIPNDGIGEQNKTNSPFFNKSIDGHGIGQFLGVYGNYIPEIKSRIPVYTKFYEAIKEIFKNNNTSWSTHNQRPFTKNHYIYSVGNLKVLHNRGMKSEAKEPNNDNYIELTMFEDCRMSATYLASIYNDLIWSNVNHKMLIPKNLLYFKLYIKFHEIRNMTSTRLLVQQLKSGIKGVEAERVIENIKRNISSVVYTLHDCRFDFKESDTWGDEVKNGGWGEAAARAQDLKFKIVFNSFTKLINPTFIDASFGLDNSRIDLGLSEVSPDNKNGFKQEMVEYNSTSANPFKTSKYLGLTKTNDAWRVIYNPDKDYSTNLKDHNKKHSLFITNNTFSRSSNYMTSSYKISDQAKENINDKKEQRDKENTHKLIQNTKDIRLPDNKFLIGPKTPDDVYYNNWLNEQKKKSSNINNNNYGITDIQSTKQLNNEETSTSKVKSFMNNQTTKLKNVAKTRGEQFLNKLKDNLSRKRAELLSNLIYKVRTKTGVSQLDPPTNVYDKQGILGQYLNTVKNDVGNDIINYAKSFITKLFN
jgi:hypothetical protein